MKLNDARQHNNQKSKINFSIQFLRMRFGVPTVLPMGGWRCDCRPRGGVEINGALDFERLAEMQRGDVMHGVRLEDEPFHERDRCDSYRGTTRFGICSRIR